MEPVRIGAEQTAALGTTQHAAVHHVGIAIATVLVEGHGARLIDRAIIKRDIDTSRQVNPGAPKAGKTAQSSTSTGISPAVRHHIHPQDASLSGHPFHLGRIEIRHAMFPRKFGGVLSMMFIGRIRMLPATGSRV